jgi:hypothetical protein
LYGALFDLYDALFQKFFNGEISMPLLDSALAFAITMLALSLSCSAFVELIHRIFKMRQAGFKYMLDQMFDQVLSKYVEPAIKNGTIKGTLGDVKKAFVERMRANRAPMSDGPYAELAGSAAAVPKNTRGLRVWGGRELTELSPVGFMERLGTMDIGTTIKNAADAAGQDAANTLDAVLKDIAQKFEALGKDATDYFEGRARFISVVVAVVFAFVVHVDAVELYTTYLQNPNATAAVIAKSEAIQKQFKTAQDAAKAASDAKAAADAKKPADGKNPPEDAQKPDAQKPVAGDDAQKLEDAAKAAKEGAEKMVKQFADLGVPLGWTDERYKVADLSVWVWSCKALNEQKWEYWTLWRECKHDDDTYKGAKGLQFKNVWFGIPKNLGLAFYLLLGGLLIGLGAPFWFNVVTGITNLRNSLGGAGGAGAAGGATGSAPQAPGLLTLTASPDADKPQPATPAGAFQIAQAAKKGVNGRRPVSGTPKPDLAAGSHGRGSAICCPAIARVRSRKSAWELLCRSHLVR